MLCLIVVSLVVYFVVTRRKIQHFTSPAVKEYAPCAAGEVEILYYPKSNGTEPRADQRYCYKVGEYLTETRDQGRACKISSNDFRVKGFAVKNIRNAYPFFNYGPRNVGAADEGQCKIVKLKVE